MTTLILIVVAILASVVEGENFSESSVILRDATLSGAKYNGATKWPDEKFDPKKAGATLKVDIDKETLRQQLSPEYRDHPILNNHKTWHTFYEQTECGPVWTSRYNKELRSANIETLADFALFIMVCSLEFVNKSTHGNNYRFHHPTPSGYIPSLKTNPFGGWGWKVALKELKDQGFNWQEFLVNDK